MTSRLQKLVFLLLLSPGFALAGDAEAGKALYGTCVACHGANAEGMQHSLRRAWQASRNPTSSASFGISKTADVVQAQTTRQGPRCARWRWRWLMVKRLQM